MTFIPLSVSLWNDLVDPELVGVGLEGFKSRINVFLLAYRLLVPIFFYCFPFLFFISFDWYYGAGVFWLILFKPLSPNLALPSSINNDNNIITVDPTNSSSRFSSGGSWPLKTILS